MGFLEKPLKLLVHKFLRSAPMLLCFIGALFLVLPGCQRKKEPLVQEEIFLESDVESGDEKECTEEECAKAEHMGCVVLPGAHRLSCFEEETTRGCSYIITENENLQEISKTIANIFAAESWLQESYIDDARNGIFRLTYSKPYCTLYCTVKKLKDYEDKKSIAVECTIFTLN